jgi:hypothetical protein
LFDRSQPASQLARSGESTSTVAAAAATANIFERSQPASQLARSGVNDIDGAAAAATAQIMEPAIFLDRDGTLVPDDEFAGNPANVRIL